MVPNHFLSIVLHREQFCSCKNQIKNRKYQYKQTVNTKFLTRIPQTSLKIIYLLLISQHIKINILVIKQCRALDCEKFVNIFTI